MEITTVLHIAFLLFMATPFSAGADDATACPKDYYEYSHHCYRIVTEHRNWTNAREACQTDGGDLVSINDRLEDEFLIGKIHETYNQYSNIWMGLYYTTNTYMWVDGTEAQYTPWDNIPFTRCDLYGSECRGYYSSPYHYKWSGTPSELKMYFICEMDPNPATQTTQVSQKDLQEAIHLECRHQGWYVTVDLDKLSRSPSDISEIYMNEDTCVGTLQGGLLVFNKTYQECNTRAQVANNTVIYNNYIMYVPSDSKNGWKEDLHCSHRNHASNTVSIKPDMVTHGSSSGQVTGSPVDIKLYTDSAFSQPLQGTVKLGTPVYVQVLSLGHPDVAMVVQSCEADIKTTSSQNQKPCPLIQNHCSVDSSTQIIVSRNQVTRFRFNMSDLPNDHDGIYVTCNVVFCDPMDFSSQCEQTCKSSSTLVG